MNINFAFRFGTTNDIFCVAFLAPAKCIISCKSDILNGKPLTCGVHYLYTNRQQSDDISESNRTGAVVRLWYLNCQIDHAPLDEAYKQASHIPATT